MKIGIIVAMNKELRLLLPNISDVHAVTINNYEFHTGHIGRHEVIAMQCGIGKVNAALGAMTLIENFHPSMVINTGVAGGTGSAAKILDVVLADRIAYHDVWCGPDTIVGQAAGCPRFFVCPLGNDIVDTLNVKHGLIASGDIFVSRREDIERIKALYPDVMAVDMESAAIAHACHLKSVPFVCIRVISDTPGAADNIEQYETFWDDAPQHTFETLTQLLSKL
jgi:adenosylhomocysteine nucleosidase